MQELINDKFYTVLKEKYNELLLDYVLLSFGENCSGENCDEKYCDEKSHKIAVIKAIEILNARVRVGNNLKHPHFYIDEDKMLCNQYSLEDFFYKCDSNMEMIGERKVRITPEHLYMTYWQAFSDPPYGIPYSREDFEKINHLLFPVQFRDDLKIYSWNNDFSNYFDDGKEWWGTALWSVYDKNMQRFVIIGASLTDYINRLCHKEMSI
ncbi:MAG: hypothetical protein IJ736_00290 [Firmicutes bacterium]|nr:hypothetical protein [Bacillota bacterium]